MLYNYAEDQWGDKVAREMRLHTLYHRRVCRKHHILNLTAKCSNVAAVMLYCRIYLTLITGLAVPYNP